MTMRNCVRNISLPLLVGLIVTAIMLVLAPEFSSEVFAQDKKFPHNYDESKIAPYTLPDPLRLENGKPVLDAKTWFKKRRPELLHLFEEDIYGRSPGKPKGMHFRVFNVDRKALNGTAVRKQVMIYFTRDEKGPKADLLLYTPAQSSAPVPLFLGLSFNGVNRVADDPGIQVEEVWDRVKKARVPANPTNGVNPEWQIPQAIAHGYGVAAIYYMDIEPDFPEGMQYGVRPLFFHHGQTQPGPNDWGAIGAWAWGLSRAMDYLETDHDVDAHRVAIVGQSRLGKTTVWAGAQDTRFAMVIASCSGKGGASLWRHDYGETSQSFASSFGYQLDGNFQKFAADPKTLPVDSHELLALIAPRPLLLNNGSEDTWSDPHGEFLAAVAVGPVYRLLGKEEDALGTDQMPPPDQPILHRLGFHTHTGKHQIKPTDWDVFFKFADLYLRGANVPTTLR